MVMNDGCFGAAMADFEACGPQGLITDGQMNAHTHNTAKASMNGKSESEANTQLHDQSENYFWISQRRVGRRTLHRL
jgi:hypothetical protein